MKKISCTVDSKYLDMLWAGSYIYTTYDHPGIATVSYKTINRFYISLNGTILGDPGAVSGEGEKSKTGEKNLGEEKSRLRRRAPGDNVLTDQFQMVRPVLASDWCQKTFVFFCPITKQQD